MLARAVQWKVSVHKTVLHMALITLESPYTFTFFPLGSKSYLYLTLLSFSESSQGLEMLGRCLLNKLKGPEY